MNAPPAALDGDELSGQVPTAGLTTKVVKGSLWTVAGQMAPLAVSFATAPFVIRLLGSEGFGVWGLIALIPTYFAFADFGMSMASTRFAARAYAERDAEREARIIRTAGLVAFVSSVPFAAAMIVFSTRIVRYFEVPEEFVLDASLGLKFTAAALVVNFLNTIFNTAQLTRLRMDLNTLVASGCRIAAMIATPILLYLGFGMAAAAFGLLAAAILTLAGHLYFSRRLLPEIVGLSIERGMAREMIVFGGAFVGAGVAGAYLLNADKGMVAKTVSSEALAYYNIASTIAAIVPVFSVAMIQSLIPAFSQLQGEHDAERLNALYSRGIRLTLMMMVPGLVLPAIAARTFLAWWATPDFARESTLPLYVMLGGLAFSMLAHFPYAAILAAGRTDLFAKLYWVQLALYIPLVWFLTTNFGIVGAAAAWSIRGIADTFSLFAIARRVTGARATVPRVDRFAIAAVVMLLPLGLYFYAGGLTAGVILVSAAAFAVYAALIWRWVLEPEEAAWLIGQLRRRLPVGVN